MTPPPPTSPAPSAPSPRSPTAAARETNEHTSRRRSSPRFTTSLATGERGGGARCGARLPRFPAPPQKETNVYTSRGWSVGSPRARMVELVRHAVLPSPPLPFLFLFCSVFARCLVCIRPIDARATIELLRDARDVTRCRSGLDLDLFRL